MGGRDRIRMMASCLDLRWRSCLPKRQWAYGLGYSLQLYGVCWVLLGQEYFTVVMWHELESFGDHALHSIRLPDLDMKFITTSLAWSLTISTSLEDHPIFFCSVYDSCGHFIGTLQLSR